MWPADLEAQAYAVAMLAVLVVNVGLLWTIGADRRHFRRKLGAKAEAYADRVRALRDDVAWHQAELTRLTAAAAVRTFEQHVEDVRRMAAPRHEAPTAVQPLISPSGSFPAITSIVVGNEDPEATTFIDARGESTT